MEYFSILYLNQPNFNNTALKDSYWFLKDTGLTKIIKDINGSNSRFNIEKYFLAPLDLETIQYRLSLFKDLENENILKSVQQFSENMADFIKRFDQLKIIFVPQQKHWYFASLVIFYIDILENFYKALLREHPQSQAMNRVLKYLQLTIERRRYSSLKSQAQDLLDQMSQLSYSLRIKGDQVEVLQGEENVSDYARELFMAFDRLREGEAKEYTVRRFSSDFRMNDLEEDILKRVIEFFPVPFRQLEVFYHSNQMFSDLLITSLYKEFQFYLTYLDYIKPIEREGLPFCIPEFTQKDKIVIVDGFDLNLIYKRHEHEVVLNDFECNPDEGIFIITGANQGGKTTYTKMIAQIFYLASVGVPVPARRAEIILADNILTHFEREESIYTGNGKLQDDLVRAKELIEKATDRSLIILNEVFSSTTLKDAEALSKLVLEQIRETGAICLFVTFIDALTEQNENTTSMLATVDRDGNRTYKIRRKESDGNAYARTLAQKYRLTYDQILERMRR